MRCPYCAEEIKDGATVCRYCDRDLSFYAPIEGIRAKTSELDEEVQKIKEHLAELRPMNEDVVLERISRVDNEVQRIINFLNLNGTRPADRQGISPDNELAGNEEIKQRNRVVPAHPTNQQENQQINQREDQQRNQQGDTGGQQSSEQENEKKDQASAKTRTLIKDAARRIIDNLTTAKPEWRLIWLSVLYASLFAILASQLGTFLTEMLNTLNPKYSYVMGLKWWGYNLANFFLACSFIFPFIFGFRASLARPGGRFLRRLLVYLFLGLLVGLMTFIGNFTLTLLGGALGLPAETYYSGWQKAIREVPYVMATWFTSAGALFILGALLADLLKAKKKELASRPALS